MGIFDKLFGGGKESAADKEFRETAIALAKKTKSEISKISESRPLGKGKAELMEEAKQKLQAIEDAVQTGTTALLIAANAIATKHGLSSNERDKMVSRFHKQNVKYE
jgi:phosphosulfolactate synthase (CoM biosynthesis protein A)